MEERSKKRKRVREKNQKKKQRKSIMMMMRSLALILAILSSSFFLLRFYSLSLFVWTCKRDGEVGFHSERVYRATALFLRLRRLRDSWTLVWSLRTSSSKRPRAKLLKTITCYTNSLSQRLPVCASCRPFLLLAWNWIAYLFPSCFFSVFLLLLLFLWVRCLRKISW